MARSGHSLSWASSWHTASIISLPGTSQYALIIALADTEHPPAHIRHHHPPRHLLVHIRHHMSTLSIIPAQSGHPLAHTEHHLDMHQALPSTHRASSWFTTGHLRPSHLASLGTQRTLSRYSPSIPCPRHPPAHTSPPTCPHTRPAGPTGSSRHGPEPRFNGPDPAPGQSPFLPAQLHRLRGTPVP